MRIVPNVIHRTGRNGAERKIFNLLKQVDMGPGWIAYHSLNVSEHQYKQWSELDFVIAGPEGIIVLEIKGGRVSCENGIWYFTDRYNKTHKKSEGPFKQAESGMYALQKKVSGFLGDDWKTSIKTGWGVVFPDITFTIPGPEMPKEVVCDERCAKNAETFRKYLKQLLHYWSLKGVRLRGLEPDDVFLKKLANYLRPNFDVSPSLHNRVDAIHREIVQHTTEQYRFLDALEEQDRIICSGGAGTGKSFLAVETARREVENGHTVLIVAMHEIFVNYLKAQLEGQPVKVCSFGELQYSINYLEKRPYDVLVVDEGQDLMQLDKLDLFDRMLKNGLDRGRWRWFMDENAQAGILGNCDIEAIDMLKSTGAVYMVLKYNCRNTRQIVRETESTTGAYVGITEIKGDGPKVEYCRVLDREDEAALLAGQLDSLVRDGANLSDMAILSPVEIGESVVSMLPEKWKRRLLNINMENVMNASQSSVLFSSVSDFKGLERQFIMLVDTGVLDDSQHSISLLYVAMTRAHAGLWVAVGSKFEPTLISMQKENILKKMDKK